MYRAVGKRAGLLREQEDGSHEDPRDYDGEYYVRLLRDTFAARLARALTSEDFEAVCADPEQLSLFARRLEAARPILTILTSPVTIDDSEPETEPE